VATELPGYAELHCRSNFSFLTGASHPAELVERAQDLRYAALAITDECSLAGVVRAHVAARERRMHLIIGSEMRLTLPSEPHHQPHARLVLLAQTRRGYGNLSHWVTVARRRAPKGHYLAHPGDVEGKVPNAPTLTGLPECLALLVPDAAQSFDVVLAHAVWLKTWFQDRAAIVLNKPPGLATQGGTGTKEHVDGLLDAFGLDGPRPRLVHRLDKDTSGVLLIARTPGSAAYFSKRFSGRTARKIYWAIVTGVPDIADGLIELPLAKQPGTGGEKMMVDESGEGQSARTRYRVLDRAGNRAAWVELQPLTGRTHQLRVHMAAIGHPIVGDGKYGGPEAFLSGSISRKMHLHARRLIIDHPDGDQIDVTADLPEHFANSMDSLGFDEEDGAALPERPKPGKTEEKSAAKAHAKQVRKERRGERRGRADGRVATRKPPTKRGPTKGKGSPSSVASKPAAKAPAARRPGPKTGPKSGPKPPGKR